MTAIYSGRSALVVAEPSAVILSVCNYTDRAIELSLGGDLDARLSVPGYEVPTVVAALRRVDRGDQLVALDGGSSLHVLGVRDGRTKFGLIGGAEVILTEAAELADALTTALDWLNN